MIIAKRLLHGDHISIQYMFRRCMANMLRQAQAENLSKKRDILKFIGEKFRLKLQLPEWKTDAQVAEFLLRYL